MKRQTQKAIYPLINLILGIYGKWRARTYNLQNTIIVASSPRGGSTWLAEIIATLPSYHMLWEPLHLTNNPKCLQWGFQWQNYIPPGTFAPQKQRYIHEILTGSDLSTRILTSPQVNLTRLVFLRGYVVKFVNANMMLAWMTQHYPVRTLLMIRHPCAVVSSQIQHKSWKHFDKNMLTIPDGLFQDYPHLPGIFNQLQTHEEILAFEWALQSYVPLQTRSDQWMVTTYEWLVTSGDSELERLFTYLQEPVPTQARKTLQKPSSSTAAESHVAQGRNPLEGWRQKLSAQQIDNILRVAHEVGITFYSDALKPDESMLK